MINARREIRSVQKRTEQISLKSSLQRPKGVHGVLHWAIRNQMATGGIVGVILLGAIAVFAPFIAPYDPLVGEGVNRLLPPSVTYLFGTDQLGRDVFSRVIYGTRISLLVGLISILLGASSGSILGLVAGYFGGRLDDLIGRVMDVFFGIPSLLLALAFAAALGTGLFNAIVAIAIINVPLFTRVARAPALGEKNKDYVLAATSSGARSRRIMLRHILPNVAPYVLIQASVSISYAILTESALSFVGLGVQPPNPSWGGMLSENRALLEVAPWTTVFPGLAIVMMVLIFNLAGDGVRDALDPLMRGVR